MGSIFKDLKITSRKNKREIVGQAIRTLNAIDCKLSQA